jgi:predicted ATPase
MAMLRRVILKGFKSIKEMDLELCSLNVLIGANGSGKSNLVSFFKMLQEMMAGRLRQYVATEGRAHSLLHYGPKVTPQLEAHLEFEMGGGLHPDAMYLLRLIHAAGDVLVFEEETLRMGGLGPQSLLPVIRAGPPQHPSSVSLGAGHQETRILDEADRGDPVARCFRDLLDRFRVYHFHDTSASARVRQYGYLGDHHSLLPDAGNLAAFLYHLQNQARGGAYHRITSTIRLIAPFFRDFDLSPSGENGKDIILNWRDEESDQIFGPHQLSDGTLRAMCLVTLLLQPEAELPSLIVVDEPELGLHPYALNVVASLFEKASHHSQVLISTQSSSFLDNFEPADIIIVDREGKESVFRRPEHAALEAWLEEYSLGEVWEKNVIGGGPH